VPDQVTRSAARLALLIALPVALLAGVLMFWGLGGFRQSARPVGNSTAPVAVPGRSLSPDDAAACVAFVGHLPAEVRGLTQRPVTAGSDQNAAYGEPPIKVGCGGWPVPSTAADTPLWTLSGICWYADQSVDGVTTWTTLDRRVPIRVTLPDRYEGQGDWVQAFTATIRAWVPPLSPPPKGCQAPSTAPS
jgi:hypothetical protein